jgi:predicted nuclease of restriction endonuclease-like (RecB) superfamily
MPDPGTVRAIVRTGRARTGGESGGPDQADGDRTDDLRRPAGRGNDETTPIYPRHRFIPNDTDLSPNAPVSGLDPPSAVPSRSGRSGARGGRHPGPRSGRPDLAAKPADRIGDSTARAGRRKTESHRFLCRHDSCSFAKANPAHDISLPRDADRNHPFRGTVMSRSSRKPPRNTAIKPAESASPSPAELDEVLALIDAAKARASTAVNTILIDLYWQLGEYISRKVAAASWGQRTVGALAERIQGRHPGRSGFSASNLWRMRQFFETYRDTPKLAPLVRELPWTHNLLIMGRSKREEEREFYLRICIREKWGKRELQRQLDGALFERIVLSPARLSPRLAESHPDASSIFKDMYLVEFVDLPPRHSEADLQGALVEQLKQFLLELGRDFCFIGSQYPVQVGGRDFALDLLFFNRALNALVAFELKVVEFEPEHLGKLQFYLEPSTAT